MLACPACTTTVGHGYHWSAYDMQESLYATTVQSCRRNGSESVDALDFGAGPYGVSRMILEHVLDLRRDHLALFDPYTPITQPTKHHVTEVSEDEIYSLTHAPFDIISVSYILCCMEPCRAKIMLAKLQKAQRAATYMFVDYTLRGMTRKDVLALLTAREEMKWRAHMGEDTFARTRTQHTRASLAALIHESGLRVLTHESLDPKGYRTGVVARADV